MTGIQKKLRGFCSGAAVLVVIALCIGLLPTARAQVFRGYSQSGSLQMKSDQRDNRKVITTYYTSGKLEAVYEYEDGKLNGVARQYYENGVLRTETRYNNDKREGTAKFYYPSGMLKARIEYQNDAQTGVPRLYDEKGKLLPVPGTVKPAATAPSSPAR
jgi:antitoxin component YwqK of YwqJK toxin-antitoxin module